MDDSLELTSSLDSPIIEQLWLERWFLVDSAHVVRPPRDSSSHF